jgi:hypothetical protein
MQIGNQELFSFTRGILLAIFFGLIFWIGLAVGYLGPN